MDLSNDVVDSGWELAVAEALESMPGVAAYVKNDHLGFEIPYTYEGRAARYWPDFLVRLDDSDVVRMLIVEVSGGAKVHHSPGPVSEKAATTRSLWMSAVNRNGTWAQWSYVEVGNPAEARRLMAGAIAELAALVPT